MGTHNTLLFWIRAGPFNARQIDIQLAVFPLSSVKRQARIEYLEREVRRLQQVETDVKYLKNALLQQFR